MAGQDMQQSCNDCGCAVGALHDRFCTRERCPFCGGQLVACGCISSVLELGDEEQQALDEYIDDTVEPLRSIHARWVDALDRKGRIPFAP